MLSTFWGNRGSGGYAPGSAAGGSAFGADSHSNRGSCCLIAFDRPNKVYMSGDTLSGQIMVVLNADKAIRGELFVFLSAFNDALWNVLCGSRFSFRNYNDNSLVVGIQLNIGGKGSCQFTMHDKDSMYGGKEVFLSEHIQLAERGRTLWKYRYKCFHTCNHYSQLRPHIRLVDTPIHFDWSCQPRCPRRFVTCTGSFGTASRSSSPFQCVVTSRLARSFRSSSRWIWISFRHCRCIFKYLFFNYHRVFVFYRGV